MKRFKRFNLKNVLPGLLFLVTVQWGFAQTPVQKNGQLKVIGTKLCNQYDKPVQLRGMSTHGIQWYYNCLPDAALDALAYDWGADVLRISLYVQEGGYETDPTGFTAKVNSLIEKATARGMYALVDWHQLDPGDPNANLNNAKRFFTDIANAHKNKNNIIYDIANEPNNVSWNRIKLYADQMIPFIRAVDADAVILCGTHGWGSLGISDGRNTQDILNNPINYSNFMYTFHFYAASHGDEYYNELNYASDRLPIFVTEWGSQQASGDGPNNFAMSQRYIDLMQTKKISWTNWNYSDDFRSGAVWVTGTCPNGPWTTARLKPAGTWVRDKMLNPADDFPGGTSNTAPSVNLTGPANGATFTAPATVNITANATDSDGTVSAVAFYNGTTLLGTATAAPYRFSWTNVPAGSYSITARATDNAGATTTSAAVNITVNGGGTCSVPGWVSTVAYVTGNKVSKNGNTYEAKWWTQGQDPVVNSCPDCPWKLIGACTARRVSPEQPSALPVKVYPNPVREGNSWYIDLDDVYENVNVSIQSISGGKIHTYSFSNTHTLKLNAPLAAKGMNIITIQAGNKIVTRKLIFR